MADRVVMAGTTKGLFLLTGDRSFRVDGPQFKGEEIYATGVDGRTGRLFTGCVSPHWGPTLRRSSDGGQAWEETKVAFPEDTGAAVERIWQIVASPTDPDVVYVGVEPAALFRSSDGGASFELVRGLWDHPHRPQWMPGGGGLCLHTILVDPRDADRLRVAVSTGGVYSSDDGGTTWEPSNAGIKAVFLPDPDVEFGQCVHKIAGDAADPDTLYLQHHWGVYRSTDFGASWSAIGSALPSDFGFPIVAHPSRPGTAYVIPLQSDEFRCTVDGRCRVYRTIDGGRSWHALSAGLPQDGAHLTILRDAFTSDGGSGLFFGTRSGEVFGSTDDGEHWSELARHLPPVLSVRAAGG